MPPPPKFHNVDFGLRTDSLWPPWLYVDLYAFQPHALRNRWKGRVLAGGMVIVLDLFLAIHVIYFLRRYVRTCVRFSCIYVTYLDPVPLVATDPSPGSVPANGCRLLQHRAVGVFFFLSPSCTWLLFRFCLSFFLFFAGFKSSVLGADGDVWKVVLKKEWVQTLLLSSCSFFILPRALGCDYELRT